jgi:pimeloyl-ACP methyl ester carboxylesterase
MPYAKAHDGCMLYYKDWGRGSPVALIHGWPLSSDTWDPVALMLVEAGHRCIFHDRRGFGRSDQPWEGYDYDTFTDDLAAVLHHAGVNEPVSLVGFSMGGGEVARFVRTQGRQRVRKAALVGSVVPYMLKTDENPNGVDQSTFDQMAAGITKHRADFFKDFAKSFFGNGVISHPVSDAVLDDFWRQAMMAGLRSTLAAAEAFASTDFRPDLRAFEGIATLVIHGTSDATVPIDATAREVVKQVPGAKLIEYDGSPHGVFATDTERLCNDLLEFLGTDGQVRARDDAQRERAY